MATTNVTSRIVAVFDVADGPRSDRDFSVNELMTLTLCERKPATVWEVALLLGDSHAERALTVLSRLTAKGVLARFRIGLGHYYASPKVALTAKGPSLRAVVSDLLKNVFFGCRNRVARSMPQRPGATAGR